MKRIGILALLTIVLEFGLGVAWAEDSPVFITKWGANGSADGADGFTTEGEQTVLLSDGFEDLDGVFQINTAISDVWVSPAISGQGFAIIVREDLKQIFLVWFTFDTERPPEDVSAQLGEPGHRWLTAQGPYNGDTANLTIFMTEGGVFDAAEPVASTDPAGYGSLTIEFADCTEGLVTYHIVYFSFVSIWYY